MLLKQLPKAAFAAAVTAVLLSAAAQQQNRHALIDARTAIERIESHDPEAAIERAENAFNIHLRSYASGSAMMPPAEAAAEWLALVDQAIALPHRSFAGALGGGGMPEPIGSLGTVMLDLPGPIENCHTPHLIRCCVTFAETNALRAQLTFVCFLLYRPG